MPISIHSNYAADRAVLQLNRVSTDLARTTERLSSGLRTRSQHAAAFFAGDLLSARIRGLQGAELNIQQAIGALEIADSPLASIADTYLPRLIEIAVTSADGLTTDAERAALDDEFQDIKEAINDSIAETTFNGRNLLDGTAGTLDIQVGSLSTATYALDFTEDFRTNGAGPLAPLGAVGAGLQVDTQGEASTALAALTGTDTTVDLEFAAARATLNAQTPPLAEIANFTANARIDTLEAQNLIVGSDLIADAAQLVQEQLRLQSGASALRGATFSASAVLSVLQVSVGLPA